MACAQGSRSSVRGVARVRCRTLGCLSTLRLDPVLTAVVERSRALAAEAGELRAPQPGPLKSPLSSEEQRVVREWLDDGGYDAALAIISAEDPDLANQ